MINCYQTIIFSFASILKDGRSRTSRAELEWQVPGNGAQWNAFVPLNKEKVSSLGYEVTVNYVVCARHLLFWGIELSGGGGGRGFSMRQEMEK
jgi:hypothetical protein